MSFSAMDKSVRILPLSYNNADSRSSTLRLLFSLLPEWETQEGEIKLTRFTDGITNTLIKAAKVRPGLSEIEIDLHESVLIRSYGKRTEILIDREREATSHVLLAERGLAPPLLARFHNGLIYRFIRGSVCSAPDLRNEAIWRGTARRLGEWHAVVPVPDSAWTPVSNGESMATTNGNHDDDNHARRLSKCGPNLWTTLQKWVRALPEHSAGEKERKVMLQKELERCIDSLGGLEGIGRNGLVMAHCDLLSGNVIVEPPSSSDGCESAEPTATSETTPPVTPILASPATAAFSSTATPAAANAARVENVCFIDYEYTTPAPAAFDLANHFAEWGGFECEYGTLPTKPVRRAFIREYLSSYYAKVNGADSSKQQHQNANGDIPHRESSTARARVDESTNVNGNATTTTTHESSRAKTNGHSERHDSSSALDLDAATDRLCAAVDAFRGVPGLYWGVWAIIQAEISQIDFDYATYADKRLGEWRVFLNKHFGENEKLVNVDEAEFELRERRWAQE